MVTLEARFRSLLTGNASVAGVVGTRIYPVVAPDSADKPYLVYGITQNQPVPTLTETLSTSNAKIEVACVGTTYASVHSLSIFVRNALVSVVNSGIDTTINSIRLDNEFDDFDPATAGEEPTYLVIQEYSVWHS